MNTPKQNSEVIDLTGSSPISSRKLVDLKPDDNANVIPVTTPSNILDLTSPSPVKRKSQRRKKKKPQSGVNSQPSTTNTTRAPSIEVTAQDSLEKHDGANASQPSAPQPSPRRSSPTPESGTSQLFCVDTTAAIVQPLADHLEKPQELEWQSAPSTSALLLPAHVHVFGSEPSSIPAPSQKELDEEDYIEYLEYDEHKDVPRYFEEPTKADTKPSRLVCKNCGVEGDHKASSCPVIVCLTCGAHNEHSTRSCPISKVCFTCGMKGHINATCPNRYAARGRDFNKYSECERCHSMLHQTNECPSLWRIYEYVADEERARVIESREQNQYPSSGHSGDGYTGDDPWCYNCGSIGHWGDDCVEAPHRYDRPEEPSAFSLYNIQSGPFYDPETEPVTPAKQTHYHNKRKDDYPIYDDWSKGMPSDVGLQGRKKNIARLEKRAREQEQGGDEDWFDRPAEFRIRGEARRETMTENGSRRQSKMSFGKSFSDAGKRLAFENPKPPSLLSRLSSDHRSGEVRSRNNRGRNDNRGDAYGVDDRDQWNGRSRRERDRDYDRERDRDYDRDRDRDKHRNRPRYNGSYVR